jgi:hypothetical protein
MELVTMPHNTPISVAQATDVTKDMHDLGLALTKHGKKVDRFIGLVKVLIVAVIVAGLVGTAGIVLAFLARQSVTDMRVQRDEARVVACNSFNDQLDLVELAIVNAASGAIRSLVQEPTLTPEQQTKFDRYVEVLEAQTDATLDPARRDCTPAGIEAFYTR